MKKQESAHKIMLILFKVHIKFVFYYKVYLIWVKPEICTVYLDYSTWLL